MYVFIDLIFYNNIPMHKSIGFWDEQDDTQQIFSRSLHLYNLLFYDQTVISDLPGQLLSQSLVFPCRTKLSGISLILIDYQPCFLIIFVFIACYRWAPLTQPLTKGYWKAGLLVAWHSKFNGGCGLIFGISLWMHNSLNALHNC